MHMWSVYGSRKGRALMMKTDLACVRFRLFKLEINADRVVKQDRHNTKTETHVARRETCGR